MQGALATQCQLSWGTSREKELTKGAGPLYPPLSAIHQVKFDQEEFDQEEHDAERARTRVNRKRK